MKRSHPLRARSTGSPAILCLSLAIFAPVAMAQTGGAPTSGDTAILTSSGRATLTLDRPDPSDLLAETDDSSLGRRWLLYRNPRHPEGPGRWIALTVAAPIPSQVASLPVQGSGALQRPTIRAGDRVILEESTPIVEARLEAIALVSAFPGSRLRVRIVLGGKVLEAIAIAPGRVALAPQPEGQP